MIQDYSIENFKVFSDQTNLKFGPITLIYGPNSSGKSSIIQSIIVLRESLLNNNNVNGLRINNTFFELGSYASVVNKHDVNKNINYKITEGNDEYEFSYSYNSSEDKKFSYINKISISEKSNNLKKWVMTPRYMNNSLGMNSFLIDFKMELLDYYSDNHHAVRYLLQNYKEHDLDTKTTKEDIYKYIKDGHFFKKRLVSPSISRSLKPQAMTDSIEDQVNKFYYESYVEALTSDLQKKDRTLYEILNSISYIGPLRPHPKRVYQLDNFVGSSVGQKGENFLSFLARDDKYIKDVNKVLKSFDIKYDIEIFRTNNEVIGDTVSILLVDRETGLKTTLVDVGFGIGQVLPIILEGLVKSKSIICIEQPEIHLHPKLQANLANFFAKDIKSHKANQWIIETHSEALLLRFQRLIRHKILDPKDISIIYVDPNEDGVQIIHIPLDKDGDFTVDWPNGFFEERLEEMFGDKPFNGDLL